MAFLPNNQWNHYNTTSEQQENAIIIWQKLQAKGWSLQAVSAMLGNWQVESRISCNLPQYGYASNFPNPNSAGKYGGFGLPQWTPWYTKIVWYFRNVKGITNYSKDAVNPWSDVDIQLEYHDWECRNGLQGNTSKKTWYQRGGIASGKYEWYPWNDFIHSTDSPAELANSYYWIYEFSSAYDSGERPDNADAWYSFLSGTPPTPPTPPTPDEGSNLLKKGMRNTWHILHQIQR